MSWIATCERAVEAVCSQLRLEGVDPETLSPDDARMVLDELSRLEPDTQVSRWYRAANDRQLSRFYEEWQGWLDEQRWYRYLAGGPYGSLVIPVSWVESEVNYEI